MNNPQRISHDWSRLIWTGLGFAIGMWGVVAMSTLGFVAALVIDRETNPPEPVAYEASSLLVETTPTAARRGGTDESTR